MNKRQKWDLFKFFFITRNGRDIDLNLDILQKNNEQMTQLLPTGTNNQGNYGAVEMSNSNE